MSARAWLNNWFSGDSTAATPYRAPLAISEPDEETPKKPYGWITYNGQWYNIALARRILPHGPGKARTKVYFDDDDFVTFDRHISDVVSEL